MTCGQEQGLPSNPCSTPTDVSSTVHHCPRCTRPTTPHLPLSSLVLTLFLTSQVIMAPSCSVPRSYPWQAASASWNLSRKGCRAMSAWWRGWQGGGCPGGVWAGREGWHAHANNSRNIITPQACQQEVPRMTVLPFPAMTICSCSAVHPHICPSGTSIQVTYKRHCSKAAAATHQGGCVSTQVRPSMLLQRLRHGFELRLKAAECS